MSTDLRPSISETDNRPSAARVDLAHFTALLVEENLCLVTKVYSEIVTEIANDLQSGITGLTNVMGYFSMSGKEENIPLSV